MIINFMCTVFLLTLLVISAFAVNMKRRKINCNEIPEQVLGEILGPAFNSRYMSVEPPPEIDLGSVPVPGVSIKRAPSSVPEFYVEDDFTRDLGDVPAWQVTHVTYEDEKTVQKRSINNKINSEIESPKRMKDYSDDVKEYKMLSQGNYGSIEKTTERKVIDKRSTKTARQWKCESRIRWLDLGPDYFPRYLRSVECTSHSCWYDMLKCKPRSFTVKLLRRKRDKCVSTEGSRRSGITGLPRELKELWIWEERAVNFCCDCTTT